MHAEVLRKMNEDAQEWMEEHHEKNKETYRLMAEAEPEDEQGGGSGGG